MSSKTFNAKNNKAKKGISPVIATVILVAVAVVIAAALAGFSSSLFGTYSSAGGSVTVKSVEVTSNGLNEADVTVDLHNSGSAADVVSSVQVVPGGAVTIDTQNSVLTAQPNGDATAIGTTASALQQGQAVVVKVTMQSGNQLTYSTLVN